MCLTSHTLADDLTNCMDVMLTLQLCITAACTVGVGRNMSPSPLQKYYRYLMHDISHQASAVCIRLRMTASGYERKAREGDFAEG